MQGEGFPDEAVDVVEDDAINSFQVPEENSYTISVFNRAQGKESAIGDEAKKQFNSTNFEDEDQEIELLFTNLDTGESSTLSLKEVDQVNQSCFHKIKETKSVQKEGAWYEFWKTVHKANQEFRAASERGDVDTVRNFVESKSHNYPIDLDSRGFDDWTALHLASCEDHIEVVDLLLSNGASINAEARFGRTALHISCLRGNLKVVKALIQKGIDINHQDEDGNTALHISVQNGYGDIVEHLIESNALLLRNESKLSPLDIVSNGNQRIKTIFQRNNVKISEMQSQQSEVSEVSPTRKERKMLSTKNRVNKKVLQSLQLNTDSFAYYKVLGRGSFGEVFLVKPKSGDDQLYAMKVLKKQQVFSKNLVRYALAQRNVLSTMNHPFIVKLHYSFQNDTKLFLIMDYCSGGDLGKLLSAKKTIPESEVRMYIAQLVLAFQALHKNMIIYRDLKPDNVVLDNEGHVRLTDFGLSKQGVYNNSTQSFCGSIAYLAPQILNKQGHTRMVDWYLLGVLTYQLLAGVPPYYDHQKQTLFNNITHGVLKIPKNMSPVARDFILKLLNRDPKKRMGYKRDASEIREHEFFQSINWTEAMNRQLPVPKLSAPEDNLKQIKVEWNGKDKRRENVDKWTYINNN